MQTHDEHEIQQAIESMMPEKLANGLTKKQGRILYMGENEVFVTDTGLYTRDRQLNDIKVEDHIKSYIERFGAIKPELQFTRRSEVEAYFENNETPIHEQPGILAKAMKNEGFKLNE